MPRFKHPPLPRLFGWVLTTLLLLLLIGLLAPQQLPVSLYKLSLISMAAVAGYWLDRSAFPEARTAYFFEVWQEDTTHISKAAIALGCAMLRKAIIIGAAMIAVGLGA